MFAICSSEWQLSDSFFCSASYLEAVLTFFNYWPHTKKAIVYRCEAGKLGTFQYVDIVSKKRAAKFKARYINTIGVEE